MTESTHQDTPPQDEPTTGSSGPEAISGQAVVDAARTGLYAAAGLADAMAGAVKQSYLTYAEGARERRAKRTAQAEEVKNFITEAPTNLPEQAKEWPDQMRARAEEFVSEARLAIIDLAERGKVAVDRVRNEGLAGVNPTDPQPDAAEPDVAAEPTGEPVVPEATESAVNAEAAATEPTVDVSDAPAASEAEGQVSDSPGAGFEATREDRDQADEPPTDAGAES